MNNPIDSTGIFDSRDLIEYIEFLQAELIDNWNDYVDEHNVNVDEDEQEEYADDINDIDFELEGFNNRYFSDIEHYENVSEFSKELEGYGDFAHGCSIISHYYFEEYCKEHIKDCGYVSDDLPWWIEINWSATSDNMRQDYIESDFEGTTYLMRV